MKEIHTYYLAEGYSVEQFNAGIVRNDNEKILEEEGFSALRFRNTEGDSLPVKFSRVTNGLQLAYSIPQNSIVVFHFPLLAKAYKWLLTLLRWRGIKTVALMIDLDGIRDNDNKLLKKELNVLQRASYIIAHNGSMKELLQQYLPGAKILTINLFDYPNKTEPPIRQLSNTVCFAGNAAKATFIYNLDKIAGCVFNVYGAGYKDTGQNNVLYKGIISPVTLPGILEGSFGLVWDGDSIEKCNDYLRYNNPHKLSLYLVAGLPVIVWKESAVASFVEENGLGFTILSLKEIPLLLNSTSIAEYALIKEKVLLMSDKISKGFFLKAVLSEVKKLS